MNKNGILHKLMLLVILIAGFGLALTLPAWKRHQDQRHARQAVDLLQQLAQQEKAYYAQHGFYTADLTALPLQLPSCKGEEGQGGQILHCAGYNVELEEASVLRARSTKYPQWFVLNIEGDRVQCEFDASSVVGELLCQSVHL